MVYSSGAYSLVSILHMHLQVVMLDENGKEMSSERMAELVADAGNTVCTMSNSNQIGCFIIISSSLLDSIHDS